ncbi:MAG TPA: hypothetical protein VFZ73_14105, partial [Gemmatimonadaceae bacterium]
MNRRSRLHILLAFLLIVPFTPTPASAQDGFWRWIEKLSGPGGYQGWGVSLTPICVAADKGSRTADDPGRDTHQDITIFYDLGCGRSSRNH